MLLEMMSLSETLVEWLTTHMNGLPRELIIFVISLLPILELRGGLLAASILGVPIVPALCICIIGNILPIPFILLFIEKILKWMKTTKHLHGIADWLEKRATGPKAEQIRKVEFMGTLLFVGIPLPGTGAWTGTLAASLLDMDFKESVLACMGGVLLAGCIMGVLSTLGISAFGAIAG